MSKQTQKTEVNKKSLFFLQISRKMCKDCVKTIFPQRETLCTETGVYIQNFAGCSKCNEQNRAPDSLISKGKFFVMSMSKLDKKKLFKMKPIHTPLH